MRHSLRPCYVILTILALSAAGCSGSRNAQRSDVQRAIDDLPSWFTNPPQSNDFVNGAGSGESPDLQMAISIARNTARARITEGISVQTGLIQRNFGEQVSVNSDGSTNTELTQFFQSLNRDIAVETLNGVQQKEQVVQDNGHGGYRVYTWLQLPVGEISRIYLERIRQNQLAHTRLRATTAFQELEQRVQEYESQRKPNSDQY